MKYKARIKWTFTPSDFFEAKFNTMFEGVSIIIEDGEVLAEMPREKYQNDSTIHTRLTDHVKSLFEGGRLLSHQDFVIEDGYVEMDSPQGGKDLVVRVKPAVIKISTGRVDIRITDQEGNVVTDTREERINAKRRFALLVADNRGVDQTLDSMLDSYGNAVKDPADELVHLYEIRESLTSLYGSESNAKASIGISGARWSTLGRLANNEPLNQGRHRGKSLEELRDATQDELDQARSIAREMIELYAAHVLKP